MPDLDLTEEVLTPGSKVEELRNAIYQLARVVDLWDRHKGRSTGIPALLEQVGKGHAYLRGVIVGALESMAADRYSGFLWDQVQHWDLEIRRLEDALIFQAAQEVGSSEKDAAEEDAIRKTAEKVRHSPQTLEGALQRAEEAPSTGPREEDADRDPLVAAPCGFALYQGRDLLAEKKARYARTGGTRPEGVTTATEEGLLSGRVGVLWHIAAGAAWPIPRRLFQRIGDVLIDRAWKWYFDTSSPNLWISLIGRLYEPGRTPSGVPANAIEPYRLWPWKEPPKVRSEVPLIFGVEEARTQIGALLESLKEMVEIGDAGGAADVRRDLAVASGILGARLTACAAAVWWAEMVKGEAGRFKKWKPPEKSIPTDTAVHMMPPVPPMPTGGFPFLFWTP